jgi:hypothetical protein
VKGNAVEFTIEVKLDNNTVQLVYTGTAEKDSMKGTVKLGDFDGTFTAKKKS